MVREHTLRRGERYLYGAGRDDRADMDQVSVRRTATRGLLSITGIVLLLVAPEVHVASNTALACGAGPGDVGVQCSGTF